MKPLATAAPLPPYEELFSRARKQVAVAQEQFYLDKWDALVPTAELIEQSGSLLGKVKPEDAPERVRGKLTMQSKLLSEAAGELRVAAQEKDATKASAAMQRLHLALRELRPE